MKAIFKKIIMLILAISIAISSSSMVFAEQPLALASHKANITPFSYQETLLISYKEYYYIDGNEDDIRVVYDKKYRTFQFAHGYDATETRVRTPVPGDAQLGAYVHYNVTVTYDFY